jgi:hypothetical protein
MQYSLDVLDDVGQIKLSQMLQSISNVKQPFPRTNETPA